MMYIDPPYNTGKKDEFIYNDDYTDNLKNYLNLSDIDSSNPETNGRYHTKWLNMIYPRLKKARNLLSEDGVIFISIDDTELYNLKKICDEIFGEKNLIANVVIQRSINGKGDMKGFANNHEYLLCYQKSEKAIFRGLRPDEEYISKFDKSDSHGKYKIDGILMKKGAGSRRIDSPTLYFPLYYSPENGTVSLEKDSIHYKERYPIKSDNSEGRWVWGKEKINKENFRLYASPNGTIYIKDYLNDSKRMKIKTILDDKNYITNKATNEIKEIFDSKVFSTPKPVKLIKDLMDLVTIDNDIILDFFSGSSTTAESLFQLNNEDKLNRNFILIQVPEKTNEKTEAFKAGYKNICEIGEERIRRAGDKLLEENPDTDIDIGFKVLKLDSSNFKEWNPQDSPLDEYIDYSISNIKSDRSELDLVYEIMLKYGIVLTAPIEEVKKSKYTFYSVGYGALIACLDDEVDEEVTDEIIEIINDNIEIIDKNNKHKNRVVFKDNSFLNDSVKTNIIQVLENNNIEDFITY